ncbi:hypothetical protein PI124_g8220 [Phytophthora idaei]|nr:hypothetical protein PI125_g9251 [Phytophthora idaei]KAG3157650.1 hypothetical protein PI126_g8194 [Phytophthora idaei]KAG3247076.1 hypothetical protein PI124_g8220 [Phytophthora idaei]
MTRRLMSRRDNSTSHSQVTPYQQIELDDGRREWENTKQELVLVKRQLVEKDALILQLKTASRRLEETLRKKEKDLQAAFAILRSPQDAKTTKTRKQELIDRLVSECLQRAATSEALAEERRRELDRLNYSSKFLRFQELEIEIEECHTEIERLRAKLATTSPSSPTAIVGKLKLSSVPLTPKGTGALMKKTKLGPLGVSEDNSPNSSQNANVSANMSASRMSLVQTATGQVRVVPLTKYQHREGFVSKTRRRALEAEYYKQVRLAQLEVECELEENLHIRAARVAKRLEAIEPQDRPKELIVDSARSKHSTTEATQGNNETNKLSSAEGDKPTVDHDDMKQVDADPVKLGLGQQKGESEDKSADATDKKTDVSPQPIGATARVEESAGNTEQAESVEKGVLEKSVKKQPGTTIEIEENGGEPREASERIQSTQKMYEDDEFDDNDDGMNDNSKETGRRGEYNVWNLDPNPQNNHQSDKDVELGQRTDNNDDDSTKFGIWNADPKPPASPEADIPSESGVDRVVWNADPHVGGSDAPINDAPIASFDNEDDAHDDSAEQEDSLPNEDNSVWNLDPSPSVPTDAKPAYEAEEQSPSGTVQDEKSKVFDDSTEKNVWNLNPMPASDPTHAAVNTTEVSDDGRPAEVDQPVWDLDPEPAAEAVSSLAAHCDATEERRSDVAGSNPDKNAIVNSNPVDCVSATEKDNGENHWNLDPTSASSTTESNDDNGEPVHNADVPLEDAAGAGELSAGAGVAQVEADHHNADTEAATNNAWNLDPTIPVAAPEPATDDSVSPSGEETIEGNVWNLDPHTGDASDPSNAANEATDLEIAQEDEGAPIPQRAADELPVDAGEEDPTPVHQVTPDKSLNDPVIDDAEPGADMTAESEPTEHTGEASYHSSPREFEDDATPEYTPPSTARDSDTGDD